MSSYTRFFVMIILSTVLMFIMMYFNTYEIDHVFFSRTRAFMALYMGAGMAFVMLLFMQNMYPNPKMNRFIFIGSILIFIFGIYMVRSQTTIHDKAWMKAMIPHHSIAILTSSRAHLDDVRVQALASGIVKTQMREIGEMKWLLDDIKANGKVTDEAALSGREVPAEFLPPQN